MAQHGADHPGNPNLLPTGEFTIPGHGIIAVIQTRACGEQGAQISASGFVRELPEQGSLHTGIKEKGIPLGSLSLSQGRHREILTRGFGIVSAHIQRQGLKIKLNSCPGWVK